MVFQNLNAFADLLITLNPHLRKKVPSIFLCDHFPQNLISFCSITRYFLPFYFGQIIFNYIGKWMLFLWWFIIGFLFIISYDRFEFKIVYRYFSWLVYLIHSVFYKFRFFIQKYICFHIIWWFQSISKFFIIWKPIRI